VKPAGVQQCLATQRRIGVIEWKDFDTRMKDYLKKRFGGKTEDQLSPSQRKEWAEITRNWFWMEIEHKADSIIAEQQRVTRDETRIDNIARWIARCSPYGCLQNACVAIAGTGMQAEQALRASIEEYALKAITFARETSIRDGRRIDPTRGPVFQYQAPRIAEVIAGCIYDIGILALGAVAFFLIGFYVFLRMDIL
jgi:hypothetical protein